MNDSEQPRSYACLEPVPVPPKAALTTPTDGPTVLCKRCSGINLDEIFDRDRLLPNAGGIPTRHVALLGRSSERWIDKSCALCRLFHAVKPETESISDCLQGPEAFHLHSVGIEFKLWLANYKTWKPPNCLGILDTESIGSHSSLKLQLESLKQSGVICKISNDLGLVVGRVPSEPPYDLIKEWLRSCYSWHSGDCSMSAASMYMPSKLIDCRLDRVITAPSAVPYIALSYVWGGTSARSCNTAGFPTSKDLPLTVSDAMRVTTELGFRYLWVDKYCIPQDDVQELACQIAQMDLVFRAAELVIIAAAGHGSDYGLPGVSRRLRKQQPRERISGHDYVSTMIDPEIAIQTSTWNTRGWTYQESVCARRKLYFTDTETVWECPWDMYHETFDRLRGLNCFQRRPSTKELGSWTTWQAPKHIAHYSRRTLTYSADALNALLGVFRTLGEAEYPVYEIYGIPILPGILDCDEPHHRLEATLHSSRFMLGLCWTHERAGIRRPEHPSWSWTGWNCPIYEDMPPCSDDMQRFTEDWVVEAVPQSHQLSVDIDTDFYKFRAMFEQGLAKDCPLLQIEGPVVDVWLESPFLGALNDMYPSCRIRFKAEPDGTSMVLELLNASIARSLDDPGSHLVALVVSTSHKVFHKELITLLVLKEMDEAIFERIGHCQLSWAYYQEWPNIAPAIIPRKKLRMR